MTICLTRFLIICRKQNIISFFDWFGTTILLIAIKQTANCYLHFVIIIWICIKKVLIPKKKIIC